MLTYLLATLCFAGIYAMLALGLNVIWGMAGMINLGLAGYFAVGAYVSALLTVGACRSGSARPAGSRRRRSPVL